MDFHDLLITAGRSFAMYAFVLLVIRLLGKREVGNFTAFDLLAALMIGEVVDEGIFGDVTLIQAFVAIGSIGLLDYLNSWGSYKWRWFDQLTGASPRILVKNGKIDERALAAERMNKEELESQLRLEGIDDLQEVKQATLEPSGEVSVLKADWAKELQKGDLAKK